MSRNSINRQNIRTTSNFELRNGKGNLTQIHEVFSGSLEMRSFGYKNEASQSIKRENVSDDYIRAELLKMEIRSKEIFSQLSNNPGEIRFLRFSYIHDRRWVETDEYEELFDSNSWWEAAIVITDSSLGKLNRYSATCAKTVSGISAVESAWIQIKKEITKSLINNEMIIGNLTEVVPIILTENAAVAFIHECIGHSFEADNHSENNINKKMVFHPGITCISSPIPDAHSSIAWTFDDEGVSMRPTDLIRNGKVQSPICCKLDASLNNQNLITGNGRSQNFSFAPLSRMTSIWLQPSTGDLQSWIDDHAKILIVDQMTQVGDTNYSCGEISLAIAGGTFIQKSSVPKRITPFSLKGTSIDFLYSIRDVGDTLFIDPSIQNCSKLGQTIRVEGASPSILLAGRAIVQNIY